MGLDPRIHPHSDHIVFTQPQRRSQIYLKWRISTLVRCEMPSVEVDVGYGHDTLETRRYQLAFPGLLGPEVLPIPGNKPEHLRIERFRWCEDVGVRHGNMFKCGIV